MESSLGNLDWRKIRLNAPNSVGATAAHAEVYEYGAHITSWTVAGDERLFLSPHSEMRPGAAIRGGVPIILPQFSLQGPLPRHGFARTQLWTLSDVREDADSVRVDLHLADSPATRQIWDQFFLARFELNVRGRQLEMRLCVQNRGPAPFSFTCALHTYLRLHNVQQAQVEGLRGTRYRLSGGNRAETFLDEAEVLRIDREVDRIYLNAPDVVTVREPYRVLEVRKQGFADCVVWNPWAEKCALMKDMPPDGYLHMVCIEAGQIETPVELGPQESWEGVQTLVAVQ